MATTSENDTKRGEFGSLKIMYSEMTDSDQNFTVDAALDASLDVVDGSAATGKLDLTTANDVTTPDVTVASVDVVDITVKGGSGNDTLVLTANAADNEILVEAGAGDDSITIGNVLTNAAATTVGDVIKGGDGTDTLAGDVDLFDAGTAGITGLTTYTGISGIETLSLSGFGTEDNTVNLANIQAGIQFQMKHFIILMRLKRKMEIKFLSPLVLLLSG